MEIRLTATTTSVTPVGSRGGIPPVRPRVRYLKLARSERGVNARNRVNICTVIDGVGYTKMCRLQTVTTPFLRGIVRNFVRGEREIPTNMKTMLLLTITSTVSASLPLRAMPRRAVLAGAASASALVVSDASAIAADLPVSEREAIAAERASSVTTAVANQFAQKPQIAGLLQKLSGRSVIITGTSPVSIETARLLAAAGARVSITARTQKKADAVAADIIMQSPSGSGLVSGLQLDLANLTSIRSFPSRLGDSSPAVDVLICCAQGESPFNSEFTLTADGFERHVGVTHLGHFALLAALLPSLERASSGFRVISVSSEAHRAVTASALLTALDGSLSLKQTPDPFERYQLSKAANVMWIEELSRRIEALGLRGSAQVVGLSDPRIELLSAPKQDATTLVALAAGVDTDGDLSRRRAGSSLYFEAASGESVSPSQAVTDPRLAQRLWTQSERLTKTTLLASAPAQ